MPETKLVQNDNVLICFPSSGPLKMSDGYLQGLRITVSKIAFYLFALQVLIDEDFFGKLSREKKVKDWLTVIFVIIFSISISLLLDIA
jgi:hypothetical protein